MNIYLAALDDFQYAGKWYKVGLNLHFTSLYQIQDFLSRAKLERRSILVAGLFSLRTVEADVWVTN